MTDKAIADALEAIYTSLNGNNEDIDLHIATLKAALQASGQKEVSVDPDRLTYNNRQGRKMMQSYFKKRGVTVVFSASKAA